METRYGKESDNQGDSGASLEGRSLGGGFAESLGIRRAHRRLGCQSRNQSHSQSQVRRAGTNPAPELINPEKHPDPDSDPDPAPVQSPRPDQEQSLSRARVVPEQSHRRFKLKSRPRADPDLGPGLDADSGPDRTQIQCRSSADPEPDVQRRHPEQT